MSHQETFRYGHNAELTLEFNDNARVEHCGQPMGEGFDDPIAAVMASLVAPLDFPALADATVQGDRVVLAVGGPVPELGSVLDGVIQTLVDGGVSAENISVLLSDADTHTMDALRLDTWRNSVDVRQHDPRDRMSLAYLAATESGHAVYMNRHICDADLVVTIGCMRPQSARGYFGVHGSVYPGFADIDTVRRFQSRQAANGNGLSREVDEAGWLLGARFTIQIIPGGGGAILHILSGDVDIVNSEGARLSRKAWSCPVTQKPDLVVAALQGDHTQQTWQNLYRALDATGRIVAEDGAIVLCTELDRPLDEMALRALADNADYDVQASDDRTVNVGTGERQAETADMPGVPSLESVKPSCVIPTLRDISIYLLSKLKNPLVEELGMVPIAKPSEISNLCRQHQCCVVLSNAQHAWPELSDHAASPA